MCGSTANTGAKNVMVGGEPLDLDKIYTVAGQDYRLKKGGGGFTMFNGCNILMDQVILDTQAVINYITNNLNGCIGSEYADPSGQGRIVILTSEDAAAPTTQTQSAETTETSESTESTETTEVTEITNSTNSSNSTVWILVAVAVCAVAVIVILKKKR